MPIDLDRLARMGVISGDALSKLGVIDPLQGMPLHQSNAGLLSPVGVGRASPSTVNSLTATPANANKVGGIGSRFTYVNGKLVDLDTPEGRRALGQSLSQGMSKYMEDMKANPPPSAVVPAEFLERAVRQKLDGEDQ